MDEEVLLVPTKKEAIEALENIKKLKYNIKNGKMTYKDAKKYLCGHIGYIQIADVQGLTKNLFLVEK